MPIVDLISAVVGAALGWLCGCSTAKLHGLRRPGPAHETRLPAKKAN